MPLIQGKSKKAFSENVKTEMEHGKPQKQSLAIAYSVKRKNARKKMASGGEVSAANEKRPMPDDVHSSENMMEGHKISSEKMPNFHDEGRPSIDTAISTDEMAMLHKYRKHLASGGPVEADFVSAKMEGIDDAHTPESQNMVGKRDIQKMPRAASGMPSADSHEDAFGEDMMHQKSQKDEYSKHGHINYAHGGHVKDHSEGVHKGYDNEKPGQSQMGTRVREGDFDAAKRKSIDVRKASLPIKHRLKTDSEYLADGGYISPEDEIDEENHASLAAAIMAKRKRMADGGEVDLQDNNGDEDLNNEDDMSFDAARKKTYFDDAQLSSQPEDSNEHGDELEDADSHDMVGSIRKKMKMKRG